MTIVAPRYSKSNLVRWQAAYTSFAVPQAAAPIAFSLAALPITGDPASGAAMVLAMTAAQVVCAVPISRLGSVFDAVRYLRFLIAVRCVALGGVAVLAASRAPFALLVASAAVAGVVNGAAYGYQRLLLNHLVSPHQLPRALGVAATLNEVTYALAPAIASILGAASPVAALVVICVLGSGPMILTPRATPGASVDVHQLEARRRGIPAVAALWLLCTAAGSGAVAAVEVGSVSLAVEHDLDPRWAFIFVGAICFGSISGGIWVSVRNRVATEPTILGFLAATALGSGAVAFVDVTAVTLIGAAVIGFFLPALSTFYSIRLDEASPPQRRAEMFAHLRTASSCGVIVVSGLLAAFDLRGALRGSFVLLVAVLLLATGYVHSRRNSCLSLVGRSKQPR